MRLFELAKLVADARAEFLFDEITDGLPEREQHEMLAAIALIDAGIQQVRALACRVRGD